LAGSTDSFIRLGVPGLPDESADGGSAGVLEAVFAPEGDDALDAAIDTGCDAL
jgi:hypothetical protein